MSFCNSYTTLLGMPSHVFRLLRFATSLLLVFISITQSAHGTSCQPGGFALRTPEKSCPIGSQVCKGGLATRCCPSSTTCVITDTAFCCEGRKHLHFTFQSAQELIFALGNDDCTASLINSPRVCLLIPSITRKTPNTECPLAVSCSRLVPLEHRKDH